LGPNAVCHARIKKLSTLAIRIKVGMRFTKGFSVTRAETMAFGATVPLHTLRRQ
jgi:hypothetical protein